jgi:hypothetical protein
MGTFRGSAREYPCCTLAELGVVAGNIYALAGIGNEVEKSDLQPFGPLESHRRSKGDTSAADRPLG